MDGLSQSEGPAFQYSGESLWHKFTNSVEKHPNNIALACTHQPKGHLGLTNTDLDDAGFRQNPYLRITYQNLSEAVNRFTNALLERGATPDTPIFSFMPNVVEYTISIWSTFKLGGVWVPINPRNLLNQDEATHMIKTALSVKSSRSAIVIVGDDKSAELVDALNVDCQFKKILISASNLSGWENFSDVLATAPAHNTSNPSFVAQLGTQASTVMFTSGTTSLPKGVLHPVNSFASMLEQRNKTHNTTSDSVICVVAPNNHAIGMIWYYFGLAIGGTIVHPGPTFVPQVMMDTIIRESCTHMALVPTMVHALLGVKAQSGGMPSSLESVSLGGAMVNTEIIEQCRKGLGAKYVENLWGMTEGCSTDTLGKPIEDFVSGNAVAVGYANFSARARICEPDSHTPVPLGQPGELHYSGPWLTKGYIGKESSDFYKDADGTQWFITGDQATMDEKGRIFIVGRYKEMIIRGGENIAPAAIEAVLMKDPVLAELDVQIVGAKDTIAGEVPVAVHLGAYDAKVAQNIQQTVLNKVGPAHVPDQTIALKDLGLDDFPRTMAGKIQKNKLTAMVQALRDREAQKGPNANMSENELAETVKQIWRRAVGYDVDENLSFASFADSITTMKTRDMIAKDTGRQITAAEMSEANNIAGLIKLLQKQPQGQGVRKTGRVERDGPVTAKDVVMYRDNPQAFAAGKVFMESILGRYSLAWDDVADVVPAYDFNSVLNQAGIMDSWSMTGAFLTKSVSMQEVRSALREVLIKNPMVNSLFMWNQKALNTDLAVQLILQQNDKVLDLCIHNAGTVKNIADLKAYVNDYPIKDAATIPGPMFDACLFFVEESQGVALVFITHHAILDASNATMFFDDIDAALGGKTLEEHTYYKVWADSYYSLRTSVDAEAATSWHVNRLKGISSHQKALWINDESPRNRGPLVSTNFDIPSILKLRQAHPKISAPTIVKAAFALACAHRSQHTHALFCNQQAARDRFPFIPPALESLGYDFSAADVAGPTLQTVVNLVEIRPHESVLSFLTRMQAEQDNQTKFAGAPLQKIISSLGDNDGPMVLETLRNFLFNWVPGWGARDSNKHKSITLVAGRGRPDLGFNMNAGLGGEKGYTVYLDLVGEAMDQDQHTEFAKEIARVVAWLVEEEHWTGKVGGFEGSLSPDVPARYLTENVFAHEIWGA